MHYDLPDMVLLFFASKSNGRAKSLKRYRWLDQWHACDDIRFSWNVKCSKGNGSFLCEIQDTQGLDIGQGLSKYVGWSGKANITHNEDIVSINSIQECVHVTIWAIPW